MKPAVVTIGETMLRFTPAAGRPLEASDTWSVDVAGAESNVAIGLARLGVRTGWISRLPSSPLGRKVAGAIQAHGVDVSRVIWATGDRQGLYFLSPGAAPRPAAITYDRAGSAMAQIEPDEVDWAYIRSAQIVHLTGITPALGNGPRRLIERAMTEVHAVGGLISLDVNYRSALWTPSEAKTVLEPLLSMVDLLFIGRRDLHTLFPEMADDDDEVAVRQFAAKFSPRVAILTRGASGTMALCNGSILHHPAVPAVEVDRVGRGDAFAAGFLHGYLRGGVERGLTHGTALAALKMTYPGDISWATEADLAAVLRGSSGEILR